jgi:putative MATE family efflux protein
MAAGTEEQASTKGGTAWPPRLAGRLGGLSLGRQVFVLALWPLLEQVMTFLVSFTDLFIAGRIADGADRVAILDAMGLSGYVAWFFNILQGAVATGVMALVSRATGARDRPLAERGLGQGVWLGFVAGCGSMVLLLVGVPMLLAWVGLSPSACEEASRFLRVMAISGPFSGVMLAVNAALRGAGDTRTPFLAMIVVNVANALLSWAFVFGPGPLGGHGVAGIAAGTVGGWICGLIAVVLLVGRRPDALMRWTRMGLMPHLETLRRIVRVGVPQSVEIGCMWLIHSYGLRVITAIEGEGSLGSHILAIRIESMSFLPGFAIGTAAAALVGQYLGAGSREMAVKAVRCCWVTAVLLMSGVGLCFAMFSEWLISLMAPGSALHIAMAAPLLTVCAIAQPFFATCIVLKTSMRGAGATGSVMRWSFGSMFFHRVIVLSLMSHFGTPTLVWVWVVFSIDQIVQAAVFARLHFRGDWLDARV